MSTKSIYTVGLLLVAIILGASFYFQIHDGFLPCPLCTLQRFAFALIGLIFLFGIFLHRMAVFRYLLPILGLLMAGTGVVLAGRQVFLQLFRQGDHEACGVSLQYMLQVLPLNEAFQKIFAGSAECTQRGFEFFYLNMAQWSLLLFIGFCFMTLYLLIQQRSR